MWATPEYKLLREPNSLRTLLIHSIHLRELNVVLFLGMEDTGCFEDVNSFVNGNWASIRKRIWKNETLEINLNWDFLWEQFLKMNGGDWRIGYKKYRWRIRYKVDKKSSKKPHFDVVSFHVYVRRNRMWITEVSYSLKKHHPHSCHFYSSQTPWRLAFVCIVVE